MTDDPTPGDLPTPGATPPRLALVGDRSADVQAHLRIPGVLDALAGDGPPVELYWLDSDGIGPADDLAGFDGVWVVPGSPYRDRDGVLAAVTWARTHGVPFLGTCGGFQHAVLEFARSVCGLDDADSVEHDPDAVTPVIVPLACSLVGEEATVEVAPDTLAARVMGPGASTERFFCRFGVDPGRLDLLGSHGLVVSGRDPAGDARVVELVGHPFFLGTLFQPELSSDATWVHPVIAAFVEAVRAHAATGVPA
jgi:CTP synthase (UTP-ammonia lyase)